MGRQLSRKPGRVMRVSGNIARASPCSNVTWEQTEDTPGPNVRTGSRRRHYSKLHSVESYRIVARMGFPRLGESSVIESKHRQSAKLREITAALEADGFIGLDAQAAALGLSRSTAWTILNGSHKSSGLSARTLNRMLAAPLLGERARAKILEYIAERERGIMAPAN